MGGTDMHCRRLMLDGLLHSACLFYYTVLINILKVSHNDKMGMFAWI
jgi:hypothetical protein